MPRILAAFLLAALMTTAAPAADKSDPSDAAMAFAGEFSDAHLSGMLSRIGGRSEAMKTLASIDAPVVAAAFDAEIAEAVERHGDEWQRNLALAWQPLLTEAEMESLAEEGAESPYGEKYLEHRAEASAAMRDLSEDLFKEILTEVVGNTLQTLTPEQPATATE